MNMKKLVAAAMALSMAMSMAVSADTEQIPNSATGKQPGQSSTIAVQAELKENPTRDNIYSVDLSWESMVFTYTANVKYTWQPGSHTYYSERTGGNWDKSTSRITVENHSNAAIEVTPSYAPADEYKSATITFSTQKLKVDSADNQEAADGSGLSKTGDITVTPGGSLPEGTKQATIGQITLSIAEASSQSETQQ